MTSRKLVGISVENHVRLENVRAHFRNICKPVPSIPALVNHAIEKVYPGFNNKTNNTKGTKHGNKTV